MWRNPGRQARTPLLPCLHLSPYISDCCQNARITKDKSGLLTPLGSRSLRKDQRTFARLRRTEGVLAVLRFTKQRPDSRRIAIPLSQLKPNTFSLSIYGDPATDVDDLVPSIREFGILVPLTVAPSLRPDTWDVISGHRRLACAIVLGLPQVPCEIWDLPMGAVRQSAVLEFNRHRRKTFSQLMREATALEELWANDARSRSLANLRRGSASLRNISLALERRNSDTREFCRPDYHDLPAQSQAAHATSNGRTDVAIARYLDIGGKDLYRQARTIWQCAQAGDIRAKSAVRQLDSGARTIHAAYKDLRRRDRFSVDFRPTPYDVWSFRHDRAFGIPHPGAIAAPIVANVLHYFTEPNHLVVDPMAGGGTTVDVCQSMGRRCLAYDVHPGRPDIQCHDIRQGFPQEAFGCNLVFCDPPYHTMLARRYLGNGVENSPLPDWVSFLHDLASHAYSALQPNGHFALLLASQTEKDLPPDVGYLDHTVLGYLACVRAGFFPQRRISCPMDGNYLPQQVRRARTEKRLLGQVRDLLVMRKGRPSQETHGSDLLFMKYPRPVTERDQSVAT